MLVELPASYGGFKNVSYTRLQSSKFTQHVPKLGHSYQQLLGILFRIGTGVVPDVTKKTPWPESASELYRQSDRRLSTKLVPNFADRGCRVVSATHPYGRVLGFHISPTLLHVEITAVGDPPH
jgi:hypothetical protein